MKFNEVNVDFCLFYHVSNGMQYRDTTNYLNINHRLVVATFDLQLAIAKTQVIENELSR